MATVTNFANAFETTLTADMLGTDLTAQVQTTDGAPASPCYLVLDPHNEDKREYVLFDGSFTTTSFVTTALANRYLDGSAAASGITHAAGAIVRFAPVAQHFADLHGRVTSHVDDADLGSAGPHATQFAETVKKQVFPIDVLGDYGSTETALRNALADANAAGTPLYLRPGMAITLTSDESLLFTKSNMRLFSDGIGAKITQNFPTVNNPTVKFAGVDANNRIRNVGVKGIYLAGNYSGAGHVVFEWCNSWGVFDSRIENCNGPGIKVTPATMTHVGRIRDTDIEYCGGHGIDLVGSGSNATELSGLRVKSNSGYGCLFGGFSGLAVLGCDFEGNEDAALHLPSTEAVNGLTIVGGYYEMNEFSSPYGPQIELLGTVRGMSILGSLFDGGGRSTVPVYAPNVSRTGVVDIGYSTGHTTSDLPDIAADAGVLNLEGPHQRGVIVAAPHAADDFARADGAVGTSTSGHPWTVDLGTLSVAGNRAQPGTTDLTASVDAGAGNQLVATTVHMNTTGRFMGVVMRGLDANNFLYILLRDDTAQIQLFKMEAGTAASLSVEPATELGIGRFRLEVSVVEDRIVAFLNGRRALVHTLSSANFTAFPVTNTRAGLRTLSDSSASRFDDFTVHAL